ncbi:unnamed protein product (mitochondrion) [Plasmodiophora brassicae]|uniref:Uncharacterized protein n=1 Tax=Plasmodiophora brassicae TaxID=37360 RepID=A0A3P3YKM4_PLABS|nr:unnamed protein product [Plasmodiophora brassicae]
MATPLITGNDRIGALHSGCVSPSRACGSWPGVKWNIRGAADMSTTTCVATSSLGVIVNIGPSGNTRGAAALRQHLRYESTWALLHFL